jgi:copper chaperone NosL
MFVFLPLVSTSHLVLNASDMKTKSGFGNLTCVYAIGVLMSIGFGVLGCGSPEEKPVDIYTDDKCSYCGMTITKPIFASEIVTDKEVLKFDDLSCLDSFKTKNHGILFRATFVMDYRKKTWITFDKAFIVATGVATPMGSGLVAFSDTASANTFARLHPPEKAM